MRHLRYRQLRPSGFTSTPTCPSSGAFTGAGVIYSGGPEREPLGGRRSSPWPAQPESQYYDDLDTAYHEALRYYDENVGRPVAPGLGEVMTTYEQRKADEATADRQIIR